MTVTVLGAAGFIGRHVVGALQRDGVAVHAPPRSQPETYLAQLRGQKLGHVICCIGMTADFRQKPFETVEAHVALLGRVLESCTFDTLTYLSSTRVYIHSQTTNEDAPLTVKPQVAEDLFNLSKLAGESLCLASGRKCRIARVSNVFGEDDVSENFLTSVLRDAARNGRVEIGLGPQSAKDYVDVRDVARWLAELARKGEERTYNLASGKNTSNAEIAAALGRLGVSVDFAPGGRSVVFPPIDTARVTRAFGPARHDLLTRLPELFAAFKRRT